MAFKKPVDENSELGKLLADGGFLKIPKVSDVVRGKVLSVSRREVRLDVEGMTSGVIRGRELFAESAFYDNLKPGDEVEATVIELENENGDMELSFRSAGQQKAWDELRRLFTTSEIIPAKVVEANKGGLLMQVGHVTGFLPVSQLSPENYPRVSGGDKNKILEKLRSLVGMSMDVRVIDVNENEEKLIVSEKSVWEERQKDLISRFRVGDKISGEVTALADFGAFVRFDTLEGLVHISEIAWQRIDHPRDLLKVGQIVEAEIIGIEGSKIFLSMKKLVDDPWKKIQEDYKIGDTVKGRVLKINPFGFFVELTPEIHGLAHVSELSDDPTIDINTLGKIGEEIEFKIVSIEPKEHRLGLSLKAMNAKPEEVKEETEVKEKKSKKTKEEAVEAVEVAKEVKVEEVEEEKTKAE
ncbi:MAG: RNA binding S1 domain protein [Candidatus Uhrbacteria bacterium GW2011_GWE2_45_35]|uniref:RNA binding S1 domain protein n=2 Tax=Candidatus Uhriibacteriota TaxID=1752732 RepID=A0A0G1LNE5_9BACT|nr:MAG: RNA binding S1 domain protein [Candidatus Uhrbacteria bacterium GW2011_GWF2_44_350]KKU07084.1 MAG: RNA binding S1 domain protein [Candidatus Uhrbacteria bacterium GW2011_GWE2_45_35]HBR80217.1 30S ribosomal protein S1 [Candidatus Uhrbacteria bacterium]HCU31806.1 30S ribosomal protein S1 [Candidatus Uhrbacteria bacterium]